MGASFLFGLNQVLAFAQESRDVNYVTRRGVAISAREIKPFLVETTYRALGALIA
jgi:hypothetical protein